MSEVRTFKSNYSDRMHHPYTIVSVYRRMLETYPIDHDTLVGTGLSGALVVPWLARSVGKSWLLVRKEGDYSHSAHQVEGSIGKRWLFVDDFIDSGETFGRCIDAIAGECSRRHHGERMPELVGAFLYGDQDQDAGEGQADLFHTEAVYGSGGWTFDPVAPSSRYHEWECFNYDFSAVPAF